MHFREILVKDVKLNVEHALGLARIFFLSILWEQILFTGISFRARHFLVCAMCATFSRQTEEAGPRLPSYRPTKYGQALQRLQRPQDFASSDVYLSSKIVAIIL